MMTPLDYTVLAAFLFGNLAAFFLMGLDKWKSMRRGRGQRIPENTLLVWCIVWGGLGGWLGMQIFRHKTRHPKFTITVPVMMLVQIVLLTLYMRYWR